jgi:hypothetical protein
MIGSSYPRRGWARDRLALAAAIAVAAASVCAAPAAAQVTKPRPAGMECRAAAAEYGAGRVWVGKFAGRRDPDDIVMPNSISVWRCFRTETDCRNWLYWMMSDFASWQWVSLCEQGYDP